VLVVLVEWFSSSNDVSSLGALISGPGDGEQIILATELVAGHLGYAICTEYLIEEI
jgi:hypothetical protein